MTLAEHLKTLRQDLGLTQEAMAAQGLVSVPGWIKIENGQRQASEKLIDYLLGSLVRDRFIRAAAAAPLRDELLTLKYLGHTSAFVRALAQTHARHTGRAHLLVPSPGGKPKRGRPARAGKGVAR